MPIQKTLPPTPQSVPIEEVALEPENTWVGKFKGGHGSARRANIKVEAVIGIGPAFLSGRGGTGDFPSQSPDGSLFEISGTRMGTLVELEFWFDDPGVGSRPWVCTGALSANSREITGAWTVGCYHPRTCGCGGGGGAFHLRRVD